MDLKGKRLIFLAKHVGLKANTLTFEAKGDPRILDLSFESFASFAKMYVFFGEFGNFSQKKF